MRPTIDFRQADALVNMALSNRGDVVGFLGFLDQDEEAETTDHDNALGMMELVEDALSGTQEYVTRRVMEWRTDRRIDPVTHGLLVHMGIDAAAALRIDDALSRCSETLRILDGDAQENADGSPPTPVVETSGGVWVIEIGEGCTWQSSWDLLVPTMPDTVAAAAIGRTLSTVVSHPAFDGQPLGIVEIRPHDVGMSRIVVRRSEDVAVAA
jgi:hypothetical protein